MNIEASYYMCFSEKLDNLIKIFSTFNPKIGIISPKLTKLYLGEKEFNQIKNPSESDNEQEAKYRKLHPRPGFNEKNIFGIELVQVDKDSYFWGEYEHVVPLVTTND